MRMGDRAMQDIRETKDINGLSQHWTMHAAIAVQSTYCCNSSTTVRGN